MLIETRTPQQPHKLYGVASSALVLGKWNLKLRMENGIDGLGETGCDVYAASYYHRV